jgi:hypothetical protein
MVRRAKPAPLGFWIFTCEGLAQAGKTLGFVPELCFDSVFMSLDIFVKRDLFMPIENSSTQADLARTGAAAAHIEEEDSEEEEEEDEEEEEEEEEEDLHAKYFPECLEHLPMGLGKSHSVLRLTGSKTGGGSWWWSWRRRLFRVFTFKNEKKERSPRLCHPQPLPARNN